MTTRLWSVLILGILISSLVAACAGSAAQPVAGLNMVPESQLPTQIKSAPANVQEAYRFAVANPELMKEIPCFCGCVAGGHTSNYACYVNEAGSPAGILQYDDHALGCGICVDITQDVMKMVQEGKAVDEMRTVVNQRYGSFGPSTDGAK
ncbi:MAG TPA: PCYCGC motif-containing (lipo)protein [Anaerolineae bacterium]|nr:PCYCGC motif-containing (lipo)protein [Anaerolineae bacterium]